MPIIKTDIYECDKCGNTTFMENTIFELNKSIASTIGLLDDNTAISELYKRNSVKICICAKCGEQLSRLKIQTK